jgi:hypothetical protein
MALVLVLACLTAVMVLFAAWLRILATEHRHIRAASHSVQAEFLADSGVARAVAQLAANANYTGETWQIDARTLAATAGATVTIRVAAVGDQPRARRLTVAAEFPSTGTQRARRTRQITIELPPPGVAS